MGKTFLKYRKLIVLLLLFFMGLAIYGNSMNNEFFWDDEDSVVNNIYIKDWRFFPKYFSENLIAGAGQISNYWRPALLTSFALDYQIWGLEPFGFHLTNIFLHILAAWLVFLLLLKLTEEKIFLSFFVSLFFLIHPLQTEAVTYIAGRADSLSSVFSLSAILFYLNYRLKGDKNIFQYTACLLFFALGLLVKEQVILLPLLILSVEFVFLSKRFNKKNVVNVVKLTLPLFLLAFIYFSIRLTLLNFDNVLHSFEYSEIYDNSWWYRLLTFAPVMMGYFKLMFIPTGLHMAREVPVITSIFSWSVLLFLASLISVVIISIKTWDKSRLITFGFLWFFIILLPRSNIFQINRPMYEHWLYLPMAGFWLALFSLAVLVFKKIKINKPKLALWLKYFSLAIITVCTISFSFLTILRNNDWQDPITFYEKNLVYTPNSFIQRNNLGMAYAKIERDEEAIVEYRRAIAINDVYPQVHHNLGNSLYAIGEIDEAIEEYREAIAMSPSFILPYNNLLNIYLERSDKDEAERILGQMDVIFGEEINYLYAAGAIYYKLGEVDKAIEAWRKLLRIQPDNFMARELIKNAKIKN